MFCSIWEGLCVTLNWKHLDMAARAKRTRSPLLEGCLIAPKKVRVQDDKLLYLRGSEERPTHPVDENILSDFIGLRSGDVERNIIRFAEKYGTLQLCEHAIPLFHNREYIPYRQARPSECQEVASSIVEWDFEEPLASWRSFSLQAQALWNMAEALRRDRRVSDADLNVMGSSELGRAKEVEQLLSKLPHVASLSGGAAAAYPGFLISSTLQSWLRLGAVNIHPSRWNKVWSLTFSSGVIISTFGAIAVQLMLEIVGTPRLAICKGCAGLFTPTRRVDRNRDQFCGLKNCQREAWRLSKEARRSGRTPLWTRPDLAELNRRRSPRRP
jgi:hypothetical protein